MLRVTHLAVAACLLTVSFAGCSSDSKDPVASSPDDGKPDAALPAPDAAPSGPAAFNGDCSTARWADVSDECWSCLCGACKAKLDVCNEDCISVFDCATKNHTLVNVAADITCEIRATGVTCLQDPKAQAAAQPLLNFDTCLIGAGDKSKEFRACDAECKVPYPGDVCARFPAQ